MGDKQKVLVISYSDLKNDPRVNRQISALSQDSALSTIGLAPSGLNNVDFTQVKILKFSWKGLPYRAMLLLLRRYDKYYKVRYNFSEIIEKMAGKDFDVVLANDCSALPLAFAIKGNARILFDAHEFAPEEYSNSIKWRLLYKNRAISICNEYLSKCDMMTTVSTGIAREYQQRFNVKPEVLTSATSYHSITPSPLDGDRIRIVHHGLAAPIRNLETLIEMMDYLDHRFTLDFYVVSRNEKYYQGLRRKAAHDPRIVFHDPVPMNQIVDTINQYDVGIIPQKPCNVNVKYSLPNKFFESIQARLAVAVTPLPDMAEYVTKYKIGIVPQGYTPESMAEELSKLTRESLWSMKLRSNDVASELSAEKNMAHLKELVSSLARQKTLK